jgi:hypothetical protein
MPQDERRRRAAARPPSAISITDIEAGSGAVFNFSTKVLKARSVVVAEPFRLRLSVTVNALAAGLNVLAPEAIDTVLLNVVGVRLSVSDVDGEKVIVGAVFDVESANTALPVAVAQPPVQLSLPTAVWVADVTTVVEPVMGAKVSV